MSVAIVGSGLAGFTAYQVLRRGGLDPGEIAVFGTDDDPAAVWRRHAAAIRQREMRSESDGHCRPATFPGLALSSVRRRRSLRPLVASLFDRYHPTVDEFLAHVEQRRARSGWDESLRVARIERVAAVDGGFELDGHGRFAHVLVAPGHPGLAWPDELREDPRAVHAYEPHDYGSTVTVVGAGLAAATEWLNALGAGAEVVSGRRREPRRTPLNVPREYFSRRGLAGFHRLAPGERAARLRELLAPSYPAGRRFDEPLELAAREGRFRVEHSVNGSQQVICATGFQQGFARDQLLSRLVSEHGLATFEDWIVLEQDGAVAALSDDMRTLSLAGAAAQWAFPAADTLAGARYVAHGFHRRVASCRTR
jgi:cation diffusion facilitator CzcD-associated flavoprotein CzcO